MLQQVTLLLLQLVCCGSGRVLGSHSADCAVLTGELLCAVGSASGVKCALLLLWPYGLARYAALGLQ